MPEEITYTSQKGVSAGKLESLAPQISGYRWLGWSDENGNLITSIPKGTKGDITLYANWTSEWNRAVAISPEDYAEPLIYEENGKYMFAYYIGDIENVVLEVLGDSVKRTAGQAAEKITITTSCTIGTNEAKSIAETIAKATTQSTAWSLSKDWNKLSTVSEEHTQESSAFISATNQAIKNESQDISLYSEAGASKTQTVNKGINGKLYGSNTLELGAKATIPVKVVDVGVSAKNTTQSGGEINAYYDKTTVNNSYWNTKSSYNASQSSTLSTTVSSQFSQAICDKFGISNSYSEGGSSSSQEGIAISDTKENSYVSSFVYITETTETVEKEIEWSAESSGYWRPVKTGNVCVFAVVVYDTKTSTYSVFVHSLLDENSIVKETWQKSIESSSFDDHQNMVIPFEVPIFVHDYINNSLGYSNQLSVDENTGIVNGFSKEYYGDDKHVHIPDYYTQDNQDGTYKLIKITGLAKEAFLNNTSIESVRLGKYITEISESAFEGCTSLKTVESNTITSIHNYAFKGCTSLETYNVDTSLTHLGILAFEECPEVKINASNTNVAKQAITSGAVNLTVNLNEIKDISEFDDNVLILGKFTESFTLNGRDSEGNPRVYKNMSIISNANTIVINGVVFAENRTTPLRLGSENVTLINVDIVDADAIALVFIKENTNLFLQSQCHISTTKNIAVLCQNMTVNRVLENNISTNLSIKGGNICVYGEVEDQYHYLLDSNNNTMTSEGAAEKIVSIGRDSYNQMLSNSAAWVLESELPEGATVVNEKWTYDLITIKSSENKYEEGYTLFSTTEEWGEYGPWSEWSNTLVEASDSRDVEIRTVAATYKTQYNYSRFAQYSNNKGRVGPWKGTWNGIYCGYEFYYGWSDTPLKVYSTSEGFNHYGTSSNAWYNEVTRQVEVTPAYNEYRYCDRDIIYTYYHQKTESLESLVQVTESDTVTNVQKWVQYVIE